ncbi:DUF397 domain-containing protein [Actinocrinis sp.]|uniref:DUF397 domain-containing protein n=1 Tax=Actinocrinis sp. TaxID=1920516 RepID=UPI0032C218F7
MWRKSSFSTGQNDCVEVAATQAGVLVRDSKNREAGFLTVSRNAWAKLLYEIKNSQAS